MTEARATVVVHPSAKNPPSPYRTVRVASRAKPLNSQAKRQLTAETTPGQRTVEPNREADTDTGACRPPAGLKEEDTHMLESCCQHGAERW